MCCVNRGRRTVHVWVLGIPIITTEFVLNEIACHLCRRDIRVAKLVLNICTGESGDRLQKAAKVRENGE